jgi:FMN reductase
MFGICSSNDNYRWNRRTTREGSSTEQALRACLRVAEAEGAETVILSAHDLDLSMYAPDRTERTPKAKRLVAELKRDEVVVIASPGYHGTLSELVKNALDYVEDLRDEERPYFEGIAVGTIACAYGWPATIHTLTALRSVVHALRGWPTPMGAGINTAEKVFGSDNEVVDEKSRLQLELVVRQVLNFSRMQGAGQSV